LVYAGILQKEHIENFDMLYKRLKEASLNYDDISEVVHLHKIKPNESFKMMNGFKSFQKVDKGTVLATSNGKEVIADRNAMLFMPLYQEIGDDGFFIIRKIKPFFLKLSAILRHFRADNLLALLPGISWDDKRKHVLKVNLKVTKFLAKPIFHLLGYRNRTMDKTHLKLYNRERVAKIDMYKNESWFN
jgi:succinylglutamate desuccinylase